MNVQRVDIYNSDGSNGVTIAIHGPESDSQIVDEDMVQKCYVEVSEAGAGRG